MKSNPPTKFFFMFLIFLLLVCLAGNDALAIPAIRKTVLDNRLTVLHSEDHSLPFVTVQLLIKGGSRRDPAGKEGLANLTAESLLLGTAHHSASEINEEMDFMGAYLSSSSGRDYSTLGLRALKKDLDKALGIFMEVLTQPAFPDEEITREKEKTIAAIQAEEDEPGEVAEKAFQKALFVSGPYGHPAIGTKESVQKITGKDIEGFYKTLYHPNNFVLAVAGDLSQDELRKKLYPLLEKMPVVEISPSPFQSDFAKGPETIKINRDIAQANIILGNAGISRDNPDFYAVYVMNYILGGGGFASRLLEEIRNKARLAYSVESFFDTGKHPGSFQVVLQTKNSSAREAISLALRQMELITKKPVSDKELEGAKKYFIGSFPLRIDTQSKIANFLVQIEYYGLGIDYPEIYASLIQSVTKEDVLRVAKKYLHPENRVLVIVANLKEAGMGTTVQPDPVSDRSAITQKDLGITIDEIPPLLRKKLGIKGDGGIVVKHVRLDSPADAAGLREGDVILMIDRNPVKNLQDFQSAMEKWETTRMIEFSVRRGQEKMYIVVGSALNQI
jgi:zinc protease